MRRFASAMRKEGAGGSAIRELVPRSLSSTRAARLLPGSLITAPVCAVFAARAWGFRISTLTALTAALVLTAATAAAGSIDAISSKDAAGGMKAAISQGIDKAIAQLGSPNGFLKNPKYTIPLPAGLEKADRALRMIGLSGDADQLKEAMNHAAEMAVADAKPVFKQAAQRMTVADAKGILTGGETSATEYFRKATTEQLTARFKPIVSRQTEKLKLRAMYDQYAGKAAQVGLIRSEDANLNDYVTARALDGLFGEIADEERAIRKDPMGQASSLIRKVFSSL
jgi:Protein of unknown function (DUF4197)